LNIEEKFIDWAPVFMDMLVKRAYQTDGYVKDCAMVLHSTQKYEQQQNHVKAFFTDKIVKDENGSVKKTELAEEFKVWFDVEQGKGAKAPKTKELYDYITKITGTEATKGGWKGYRIVYDDNSEMID
jgi:phage/plasmid-associated DNA primase